MKEAGITIDGLRAVGGAVRSPVWLQTKADITKCNVVPLKVREAARLGAAILAGTAAGEYSSVDEGVKRTVMIKDVYQPNENMYKLYNEKYNICKDICGALEEINKRL